MSEDPRMSDEMQCEEYWIDPCDAYDEALDKHLLGVRIDYGFFPHRPTPNDKASVRMKIRMDDGSWSIWFSLRFHEMKGRFMGSCRFPADGPAKAYAMSLARNWLSKHVEVSKDGEFAFGTVSWKRVASMMEEAWASHCLEVGENGKKV